MKKEDPDNKQPEYTRYSEDEEQVLDLNELMDVQGGIDDKELSKCGLGCYTGCLLYTSPSPRDRTRSRMPSSA